jgi:hypothetical protein
MRIRVGTGVVTGVGADVVRQRRHDAIMVTSESVSVSA